MRWALFFLFPLFCLAEVSLGEEAAGVREAPSGEAQETPLRPECEKLLIQRHKLYSRWEYLSTELSQAPPGKSSEVQERLEKALSEFNQTDRRYNQLCTSGGH